MHVRPRHSVCRVCQQIVSYACTFTSCWFQHFRKYGWFARLQVCVYCAARSRSTMIAQCSPCKTALHFTLVTVRVHDQICASRPTLSDTNRYWPLFVLKRCGLLLLYVLHCTLVTVRMCSDSVRIRYAHCAIPCKAVGCWTLWPSI